MFESGPLETCFCSHTMWYKHFTLRFQTLAKHLLDFKVPSYQIRDILYNLSNIADIPTMTHLILLIPIPQMIGRYQYQFWNFEPKFTQSLKLIVCGQHCMSTNKLSTFNYCEYILVCYLMCSSSCFHKSPPNQMVLETIVFPKK